MEPEGLPFWSFPISELLERLQTTPNGLPSPIAEERLLHLRTRLREPKKKTRTFVLLIAQFKSPIILILIFAAGLSFFLHDSTDALIILTIVLASGLLGFWQERGAARAVEKLVAVVQVKSNTLRDGHAQEIPVEGIVPGDVILLSAGDSLPGDCLILEAKDLFVNEATLTGETYPVEKAVATLPPETPLAQRSNTLFLGTHIVSGTAKAVVVRTGIDTEFGKISERLKLKPPETEFERGVRRFGYLLVEVTLVLVIAIFSINVYLMRPVLDSFLFALALAIGLTPQLLPAIIAVNLAHGAKRMAFQKVIVRRLASIENFGSMDTLCSDKTGTLTQGVAQVYSFLSFDGRENEKILFYAYLNAYYETGFRNPIDEAIRTHRPFDVSQYQKVDEVPYDFIRKRLSILVSTQNSHVMVTKGALPNVLSVCSAVETCEGDLIDLQSVRDQIEKRFEALSSQGYRILGIAYKEFASLSPIRKADETELTFLGFLVLFDPPKSGIEHTIRQLNRLGISLKIITGDNRWVAAAISQQIGINPSRLLTGSDLRHMSDEALLKQVNDVDIFSEVEPNQKERIILALKKGNHVVGYMGDGINDASALHAADVGISVNGAVDVAKEAADIVLLDKDLNVLLRGVAEGRKTFSNTLKYVFMATSANFGNMFSMAGASLFLPFLPMLPKQILLTNLLTDFPEMTIAMDSVDPEMIERPRRWDIRLIRNFMLVFGSLSSLFDFLTFGALLFLLHAPPGQFRTGWFVESVISASVIVLVVRTRRSFFKSSPGQYLSLATILVGIATLVFPFTPLGQRFGFTSLPTPFLPFLGGILLVYVAAAEITKRGFYRRIRS